MAGNSTRRELHTSLSVFAALLALAAVLVVDRPGSDEARLQSLAVLSHQPVPPEAVQADRSVLNDPSQPEPPTPPPDLSGQPGVVRFVYFVEADATADPDAVTAIGRQAEALQAFWYEQFGGTFALAPEPVVLVEGQHAAAWYDETPNGEESRWFRLLNMKAEVRRALDLSDGDGSRIVVYPATRIDGRVGAIRYNGAWMDGDDITCIDGDEATVPYAPDYPANCLMTVAHELGHVYGLGHQGEDRYCMQFGFYRYLNGTEPCDFSPESRQQVIDDHRNQRWLAAVPGQIVDPDDNLDQLATIAPGVDDIGNAELDSQPEDGNDG